MNLYSLLYFLPLIISTAIATDLIYVFAYSWTPGFCLDTNYVGCSNPQEYWKTHFTIHGLWPQYATDGYPSYCSTEPFDSTVPSTIGFDTMTEYWPDVKYSETSSDYDSFWEHEWSKHGTCSQLSQINYFQDAIDLAETLDTPIYVSENIGKNISASTLRDEFGGNQYISLQCNDYVLVGAYTCWSQTNGVPSSQIVCPTSVQKEDTCHDEYVFIETL